MTATDSTRRRGRRARKRWIPFAAATTAAVLAAGAVVTAAGSASAASAPNAQSAGNFLDATAGGKPIDQILALAYARAQNPGSVTDQNPLDVTALGAIHLPLTGKLQLPQLLGVNLGAVNQVALAKTDGASYGASGAVLNSGGVSVGGNNSAPPSNASIDLCASAVSGGKCGTNAADALGAVKATVNGVSSIARTPVFGPALPSGWPKVCAQSSPTCYDIASANLSLGSPMLAGLLAKVNPVLTGILSQLSTALGGTLPKTCTLTPDLNFDGGVLHINGAAGSITFSVGALLAALGLDLNELPPNTDLTDKVIQYLTSPDGLAKGVTTIVNGLTTPLASAAKNCTPSGTPGAVIAQITGILTSGQQQLETTVNGILGSLGGASAAKLVDPLTTLLKKVLEIGVNVRPQLSSGDFTTRLDKLPKQGMTPPPVPYEYTVRAIEVQALSGAVTLALANSAAGPSHPVAAPVASSSAAPSGASAAPDQIPTGVPAGSGTHGGGLPLLPLGLLLLALMFAGGGAVAFKLRGRLNHR